jgi:hypothetical protein
MKKNPAVPALVFAALAEVKRNRPSVLFRAGEVIE